MLEESICHETTTTQRKEKQDTPRPSYFHILDQYYRIVQEFLFNVLVKLSLPEIDAHVTQLELDYKVSSFFY